MLQLGIDARLRGRWWAALLVLTGAGCGGASSGEVPHVPPCRDPYWEVVQAPLDGEVVSATVAGEAANCTAELPGGGIATDLILRCAGGLEASFHAGDLRTLQPGVVSNLHVTLETEDPTDPCEADLTVQVAEVIWLDTEGAAVPLPEEVTDTHPPVVTADFHREYEWRIQWPDFTGTDSTKICPIPALEAVVRASVDALDYEASSIDPCGG